MSGAEVDAYLAALPALQRECLERLRSEARRLIPEVQEGMSYAMPCWRGPKGKAVLGLAGFARHLGAYPHSGTVIPRLAGELVGFKTSKSGVMFTPEQPLPKALLARIIALRLEEIGLS